jgi:tetratricopeptide (TPR) repeat protein
MVAGQPNPDAPDCAFPPALLHDDDGNRVHEPLAADVSARGDGPRNAALKIAAGLLGVGVDELKQRDAQRQARVWSAVAAGALVVAALTIGLAVAAMLAREEAELRRQQAENLIGFMLGDLRGKLEPIGKLDVLDAVGDQSMAYFAAIGERGSEQEMLARAMALRQIGEVRFSQGKLEPALAAFGQSLDQARRLYEQAPDSNQFLFELGQAEFWVGYVAWQRNDLEGADAAFVRYMQRSTELLAREPGNRDYRLELSYAYSNLGSVARERGEGVQALDAFERSNAITRELLDQQPDDEGLRFELAEGLSWIGSTLLDLGRLRDSEKVFQETFELLAELHALGTNPRYSHKFADVGVFLARIALHLGKLEHAGALLQQSVDVSRGLVDHDPSNSGWRRAVHIARRIQAEHALALGQPEVANAHLALAHAGFSRLAEEDPSNQEYGLHLAMTERAQALRLLQIDQLPDALALAQRAHGRLDLSGVQEGRATARLDAALIIEALGRIQHASGASAAATASWLEARKLLDAEAETNIVASALGAQLACHMEQQARALELVARLRDAGFADPRYPITCVESHAAAAARSDVSR